MSSPGIEKWIKKSPQSWAKLAKNTSKKTSFQDFQKKFWTGAKEQNKEYLKEYITSHHLRSMYEARTGNVPQKIIVNQLTPILEKTPKIIKVKRHNKVYSRVSSSRWGTESKLVLRLASRTKSRSVEWNRFVDILMSQGRTRQAAMKKIQRERKKLEAKKNE